LLGLLAGAAARTSYSGRQPQRVLLTMLLGMVGALVGGMISWKYWPLENGRFHSGNVLLAIFGSMAVIVLWAGVAHTRRRRGYRDLYL
jgi:uncharacterized membrane protein YeaQ/YmgE (transglycosylase-associated protein family)